MDISGASAIVTGGASGLGEATSRLLTERGAKVVVLDMNEDKGNALASELGGAFCKADVTSADDVIAAVETAKELGPLRVLVNCAGIGWATRTIGKDGQYSSAHDLDVFRKVVEVNLIAPYLVCRAVVPKMIASGYGRIVNIASIAGKDGNPNASHYSASKAGLIGLTKSLGKELATQNIMVNCITPAAAKTDIFAQMKQEHIDFMLSKIPMNRFVEVKEIAAMIAWLSSEDCSFTTGGVFDISGGRGVY